jgi:hypothetical protein
MLPAPRNLDVSDPEHDASRDPLPPAPPTAHPVRTYVEDGARIAAILLVWGVIAAFCTFALSEFGGTGGLFETFGPMLGSLFALTGVLNAVLYVVYRAIDYWRT